MLHEVSFPSYNKRDQVQGWIYVPAAQPKGIVQLVHGFGEHSRRYFHMIVKFMDAGIYCGCRRPRGTRQNSHDERYLGRLGRCRVPHHDGG